MDARAESTARGDHDTVPATMTRPSPDVPDWSREAVGALEWNPSRQLLRTIRSYTAMRTHRAMTVERAVIVATYRWWSAITGADIPLNVEIAGGLLMPHPQGIVIHPDVRIGPNCLLMQQVTLGVGTRPGVPILEGAVDIGAGAKVLGGVRLGAGCRVGANAVVLDDVAPGETVVGIPAQPVERR